MNFSLDFTNSTKNFKMGFSSSGGGAEFPIYDGETTVEPSRSQQILSTAQKVVMTDIVVEEISLIRVPSPDGGTVCYIGKA